MPGTAGIGANDWRAIRPSFGFQEDEEEKCRVKNNADQMRMRPVLHRPGSRRWNNLRLPELQTANRYSRTLPHAFARHRPADHPQGSGFPCSCWRCCADLLFSVWPQPRSARLFVLLLRRHHRPGPGRFWYCYGSQEVIRAARPDGARRAVWKQAVSSMSLTLKVHGLWYLPPEERMGNSPSTNIPYRIALAMLHKSAKQSCSRWDNFKGFSSSRISKLKLLTNQPNLSDNQNRHPDGVRQGHRQTLGQVVRRLVRANANLSDNSRHAAVRHPREHENKELMSRRAIPQSFIFRAVHFLA